MKHIVIINGAGGVGKDTLCNAARARWRASNISSIDPIKNAATMLGWTRFEKDDVSRRFLSDLKRLSIAYNDYPSEYIYKEIMSFYQGSDEILFVHIREPEEIAKLVQELEELRSECPDQIPKDATKSIYTTLLVRRDLGKESYGNDSDDNVENYDYDCYFDNNAPIEESREAFCNLLADIVK